MKMQPIMVKIMKIKGSWGPLKVWGPREVSAVPSPSLSVGLPVHLYTLTMLQWQQNLIMTLPAEKSHATHTVGNDLM